METTTPKPFVFVLMPFDAAFNDTYKLGIKQACEDAGTYCERVDEQIFQESILQRIYNQIAKADIVVADMSGRNPNVFYETGYAHALGKRVILLTRNSEDIPFDLKHYPHIVYGGSIVELKSELERRVKWFVENPEREIFSIASEVEFFVEGTKIVDGGVVIPRESRPWYYEFKADIHNTSDRILREGALEIALIIPGGISVYGKHSFVELEDGKVMLELGCLNQILPDAWDHVNVKFNDDDTRRQKAAVGIEVELRVFSEFGTRTIKFRVQPTITEEARQIIAKL